MIVGMGVFGQEVLKYQNHCLACLPEIHVPTSVDSKWRIPPIISKSNKNLSDLYHGVAPLSSFTKYTGHSMDEITKPEDEGWDYNIVWKNPPRSIKHRSQNKVTSLGALLKHDERIYSCLSVVPNLVIAKEVGDLSERTVPISDHLIVPVGSIAKEEARINCPIRTAYGPLHRVINLKNCAQISIRPKVDKSFFRLISHDLKLKDFRKLDITKLLAALYLRYGYDFASRYEVVAQILIKECYIFETANRVVRENIKRQHAEKIVNGLTEQIISQFTSFEPYHDAVDSTLPGIHLGYDRRFLKTGSQIKYLDTSLAVDEKHPTIEALNSVKDAIV